jgi:GT2 family glycosyltransferase
MNVGIKMALEEGFDYILLSNNDIVYEDETVLTRLVQTYKYHPEIGALSPRTEGGDSKSSLLQLMRKLRIGRIRPTLKLLRSDTLEYNCHYGCVLIPASVFSEVGLLPKRYFLYYEDIHHVALIEDSRYVLATTQDCYVVHRESDSSGGGYGELMSYYITRNRLLFYHSYLPKPVFATLLVYYLYWVCTRFAYRLYLREWDGARALIEGAIHGLKLKDGKGPYPHR